VLGKRLKVTEAETLVPLMILQPICEEWTQPWNWMLSILANVEPQSFQINFWAVALRLGESMGVVTTFSANAEEAKARIRTKRETLATSRQDIV